MIRKRSPEGKPGGVQKFANARARFPEEDIAYKQLIEIARVLLNLEEPPWFRDSA